MHHLIHAVRRSIQEQNWYAALTGALSLPDIAAKIDGGGSKVGQRYIAWFNEYLRSNYENFLSGEDCYALRCAYLHEGDFDITNQKAANVLQKFHFTTPPGAGRVHCNRDGRTGVLQLQVDVFADDICQGVEQWLLKRGAEPHVSAAIANLPLIELAQETSGHFEKNITVGKGRGIRDWAITLGCQATATDDEKLKYGMSLIQNDPTKISALMDFARQP